jgi:hypothetical protein
MTMPDVENPYRLPEHVGRRHEPLGTADLAALNRLRVPAIALLILSSPLAIVGVIRIPILVTLIIFEIQGIDRWGRWATQEVSFVDKIAVSIFHAALIFIAIGAWRMLIGRNYRVAYAAAILSVIPLVSPMIICGIPFGIWALVVLHRKDVQATFAAKAAEQASK